MKLPNPLAAWITSFGQQLAGLLWVIGVRVKFWAVAHRAGGHKLPAFGLEHFRAAIKLVSNQVFIQSIGQGLTHPFLGAGNLRFGSPATPQDRPGIDPFRAKYQAAPASFYLAAGGQAGRHNVGLSRPQSSDPGSFLGNQAQVQRRKFYSSILRPAGGWLVIEVLKALKLHASDWTCRTSFIGPAPMGFRS